MTIHLTPVPEGWRAETEHKEESVTAPTMWLAAKRLLELVQQKQLDALEAEMIGDAANEAAGSGCKYSIHLPYGFSQ